MRPCPICGFEGGFHDDRPGSVHSRSLPAEYRHKVHPPKVEDLPKGRPSDEEIERRRAAKRDAASVA